MSSLRRDVAEGVARHIERTSICIENQRERTLVCTMQQTRRGDALSKLGYAGKLFLVEISNLAHQRLIFAGKRKGGVGWKDREMSLLLSSVLN